MGGAGLVFAEMTAVSEPGRITPGCPGIYSNEQVAAWKRISKFIHAQSPAKFCLQLGHSGRKGSTKRGWEGMDHPLEAGNWSWSQLLRWRFDFMHVPREITRADMDRIHDDYARAATNADKADFDMIEVHAGHGYLLSGFISPLSNERKDEYGGSLENRMRFPLELFDAVRANWPSYKPISVRISATDWAPGGTTPEDGLKIAAMFRAHGADIIDVSAGQTSRWANPVYGRMFQTPFSEMIRNELRIPTIAVGNITTADQVNTIIAAGRADLRIGAATSHQSAIHPRRLGRVRLRCPVLAAAYLAGKDQAFRLSQRQRVELEALRSAAKPSESRSAPGAEAGRRVDLFSWREHMHASLRICLAWLCASALAPCVAAAQTVKIGYIATLSGQQAQLGIDSVDGFKLALQSSTASSAAFRSSWWSLTISSSPRSASSRPSAWSRRNRRRSSSAPPSRTS